MKMRNIFQLLYGQHDTEDDHREGREQNIEHGLGEKLDAVVVFDAAYQVASASLLSKNLMGSPHQLREETGMSDTFSTRTDVEQYTAPDHLNKCAAEYQQGYYATKMSCYKIQIPCAPCLVYNGLGEKRGRTQLQQTAGQQADDELYHRLL